MQTHTPAPFPANEERRLATLDDYALLDSPGEALFDSLTALGAQLCATPMAFIAVLDRERHWFKAKVGLADLNEIARDGMFGEAVPSAGISVVTDTLLDARWANNPLVRDEPHVRFFAGVPLTVEDGQLLGTLCVLDRQPRTLTDDQRNALVSIGTAIVDQFELRRTRIQLLDGSAAEFYEIDTLTQRVQFGTDATRRKLGYSLDEARDLALRDVFPTLGEPVEFDRVVGALRSGRDSRMRLAARVRRKSGATHPLDLRLELLSRAGTERVVAFGTDVSDAATAANCVALLTAATDAVRDEILIATPGGAEEDHGTIVYVNDRLLRANAVSRDAVVGRSADVFFGPKTDRDAIARLRRDVRDAGSARAKYIAYRSDGSEFLCETFARAVAGPHGALTHVVYVQHDVSDPMARQMSLELLNDRLTTLTDIARDLFAALDPRALVDMLVRGVSQLTGGTAEVLARGTDAEFIHTLDLVSRAQPALLNDDFLRAAAAHDGALLSGDGARAGVPVFAPSGNVSYLLDVHAGNRPFALTDAFALGLLGQYFAVAIRNVELYRELSARRAAVIELNQVKNDLIAMLAHDFKGPLTTIVGLADVLAEDERFDAESRQFLEMINSSAMRLASLASDTLALSRLEQNELSLRFDRVDMVLLLRDVARVLGVTRPIDMRSSAEISIVRADGARLRQVFENLIGNAIKYSPGGQTVVVMVHEKRGGVDVLIRDQGIGIPAADRGKLFGRFARGSNARELGIGGTGFGLYLSRMIIEMHGGHITVESEEGAGSTFHVFVPAVPAPQPTLDRRVLLLDSEADGRSFIAHTLRDEGYAVSTVANEAELLVALDNGRFDAAIVDVDRLVMTAHELVERIAHRTTLVRLVSIVESEGTGWNAALRKPFLIKDLQGVLESAVAERRRSPRAADSPT